MLYNRTPFSGKTTELLHASIEHDAVPLPPDCPPSTKTFFKGVLDKNPLTRMTLEEMGNHPFITHCGRHPSVLMDNSAPVEVTDQEQQKAVLTARGVTLVDFMTIVVKMKSNIVFLSFFGVVCLLHC